MILPDVNVLLYAYDAGAQEHEAARLWWGRAFEEDQPPVGLAWTVILGFVRISTSRNIWTKPFTIAEVAAIVRSWLTQPSARIIAPGEGHADILFRLLEEAGTAGNLTTDAHLAALAIEYRAEVATADADFSRFRGVRWFNPVASKKRR
jgi:toxin-antitoxin system PIN domain toxin